MKTRWKIILILSLLGNLSILYVGYKALEYRRHINEFLVKYTNVVAEFSERAHYEADNLKQASSETVDNRVVLFGTQVTSRWRLDEYTDRFEVLNRGVPGQRVAGYLLRFRPDVIDLAPFAAIIEISSYNFRPQHSIVEITDYVMSMAELARLHGIEPILTTVIPLRPGTDNYGAYSVMDSLAVYNDWIVDYASVNGYPLIDLNGLVVNDEGWLRYDLSYDDIDLNERGYVLISHATLQVLDSLSPEAHHSVAKP